MGLPQQRQNLFSQFSSSNTNVPCTGFHTGHGPTLWGLGEAGQPAGVDAGGGATGDIK